MRWPTCHDLTVAQAAYLAGLIDGEGYVAVTRTNTGGRAKTCVRGASYRLMVNIHMTDRRPLDFAADITGVGQVVARKAGVKDLRPAFVWTVWSRQAAQLLAQIHPYLVVKKELADLGLEFQAMMRMPGPQGLTDHEWNERERLWRACKEHTYGRKGVSL